MIDASDEIGDFYAEISTPTAIRESYAPEGRCLGCDAKLSRYRTQSGGEWDQWCSPCYNKGVFPLQCLACWETFPSYGTRTICSKCLVPSQRKKRHSEASEKAHEGWILLNQNVSFQKIADDLGYNSALEARRAIISYIEINSEGVEICLEN